jgi:sterol desaturase/sphingolipid hydroxylase (fatty acid hydroxylase superfamily)
MRIENEGTVKLSDNPFIEALTRTSPYIIIPLDISIIVGLLYWGFTYTSLSFATYWWVYFVGLFSWTLFEYLMHRFAFHFEAKTVNGKKRVYIMHGVHHHYPKDEQRLFLPPLANIFLVTVIFILFYFLMGNLVFLFLPGFINGYLIYSSIHYSIHKFKPPFGFMKVIWRNHNLHHYRFQNKAYGVSSPLWDFVFGTLPPKEIVKED